MRSGRHLRKYRVKKRRLAAVISMIVAVAVALILIFAVFPNFQKETKNEEQMPAAQKSAAATSAVSSAAPTQTVPPTTAPTEPQPAPSQDTQTQSTKQTFENTAFVGNSCLDDLYTYGLIPEADFFFRLGLTVDQVFEKTTATGTVPVIDELNGKTYDDVFLMFGENELGWSFPDVFIEDYGKVIDAVKEKVPSAKIIVQSIFPVSRAVNQRNQEGENNERIAQYNAMLAQLCADKGVVFADVGTPLADAEGFLPDDASSDGVHPNKDYCLVWVDTLKQYL